MLLGELQSSQCLAIDRRREELHRADDLFRAERDCAGQHLPLARRRSGDDYVYAAWTDGHGVKLAISTDHGRTFPTIKTVSSVPTTVMPEVAAYNGKVDVVYYGTTGSSNLDSSAVWNTYDAQSSNSGLTFTQLQVSKTPNHFGIICTNGPGCQNQLVTRTLLDLFEVAENPLTGKASIIYTDDTFNTWVDNGTTYPLPQIVLAQEG